MPVLAANQVTLTEVLEVKGSPLNEEEIWAVLSLAGKDIEHVLAEGRGKQFGQPSLMISPDTLILSHSGHVKVSSHVAREKSKNPAYRAPELNSRAVSPSDGAVEKMYVYSLGMTLYYSAEYSLKNSKMSHLSVSLGNLLLSMCEELARSRYSLRQVLAACGSKYGDNFYSKIIKGLVVLVLGNNIPQVVQRNDVDRERSLTGGYSSDDQHPSFSLRARYRRSLELPSPPLVNRASRGQVTSEELIGSNDRTLTTSPKEQPSYHSKNKYITKIPHTLDKYRKYLEKARHQKTVTSPIVADRSIDLRHRYGSMPVINGRHTLDYSSRRGYERTQSLDRNDKGLEEDPMDNGWLRSKSTKLRDAGSGSLGSLHTAPSSDASSETSSLSDNHPKSTLSSAPSSSLVSLMEGSYVPASSLTDLGSDYWGSMASLRDVGGSQRSGEWHRSSIGDLRSVSQLSSHDRASGKNGFADVKPQWPSNSGQRKYRSEQNLASPDATDGGKKAKKVPTAKLRKFFGPEFVQVLEDPNQSLVNISPRKPEKPISGRRMVTVVMLNEQRLEMSVESSTKVQELFTQISKYIGITEKIYFGLTRIEDEEHLFLDFDTKLSKYAPAGWKEQSKKFTGKYVLYFRVKFYVENLALFRHHETSHQLYLQLRCDVIKDHVYTDVDPVLSLASLALQAEYGDYNKKRFGESYFKPKHYLPHRILVKLSEDHVCQKLRALHKLQCGLSQEEAEVKFIKDAQKLSEYGMHLYKAEWSKKENQIIYLGICVRGVTIFELRQNKRKALEKHAWPTIKKLAFKKKKFYIEPRKEDTKSKKNRLTFVSASYKRSKYLLYLCTSFHRFQMRMKVRLLAMEETSTVPDEKKRNSTRPGYEQGNPRPHVNGDSEDGEKLLNGKEHDTSFDSESRDPRRASSANGGNRTGVNVTANSSEGGASPPYVLNSTFTSHSGNSDKSPSPGANQKRTADVIMSPDRKIKMIKLKKDERGALGLTVVGGEDSRRLHYGIFIKRISPGSISHEDGRLQVGDRILAVNGKSLEYVSHDEAVQTLKNTPVDVELLVSQSTRTDSDIDMSTMSSPAVDQTQRPSSSHEHRISPYLVEDRSPSVKMNSYHNNDDVIATNVARDLESAYPADTASTLETNSPHNPRRISGSSSDMPASNPSSPEQWIRRNHHGGIKLPGMTDGQLEGVKLIRNGHLRTSRSSQVSDESPGSIASFREKVNRQNSLPYPEMQNYDRKSSVGSAISNGRLGRSRSNSETTPAEIGSEQTHEDGRGLRVDDFISGRARNGSGQEVEKPNSKNDRVHVGIARDTAERRRSQVDRGPTHFTVELDKVSGSLGLNVMGGTNTTVPDGAIFVKSLFPNGPADLDGHIQVGHKILSVNGIRLQGVTHRQAVETIKRAPVHTVLVIEGKPGESPNHMNDGSREQETVFEVVLMKGIGGLGMSLVGGTDYGEEYGDKLRIKAMFPGQPAENSEKLRIGDIILAANDVPLVGKTSRDAINVLRDQPTRVVLTVKRDPASIPPALLRRGSFSQSLDPNEVLSAIQSKLQRDDSRHSEYSAFDGRPGNEESSQREAHVSASRRSSNTRGDNGMILQDQSELYLDDARKNEDNDMVHGSTSRDKVRTYSDTSVLPDNDPGLQTAARRSSTEENHRAYGPGTETVETLGGSSLVTSHENDLIPRTNFLGLSSDSMSDDHFVEGDDLEHESKNMDPRPEDSSHVVKEEVLSPLESLGNMPKTEGAVDDESGKQRRKKSSSGGLFQAEKKEKLAPNAEVLDIILHKGSSGLGFTLAGGADTVGGCFVREIIGDPARSDGRLRPKDQIVMVNGQDTTNKKHMEAVNILRSTRNEVHLVICRRPDKVKGKTKDGLNIKTISVIRTTRGLLGLTLAEDKQGQIYAAEVIPDEPAAKHGGLKRRDIILEINGERVDDAGLKFATECLDRARPVVTLVIKQYRSETESKYVLCSPTESDHEVPEDSSQAHASRYNIRTTVVESDYRTQDISSNNPEFSPAEKLSAEILPSSVLSPEHPAPELLSTERVPSEEPSTELILSQPLDGSLEPAQRDYEEKQVKGGMESLPANNSYSEEVMTRSEMDKPENEEYPSDDDDLLFKEEVITTALHKSVRGLGFSLFSGQTVHDTPGLFIRSIQPNSVVEEDGKIKVGDQLLKVNGEDVERLDHSKVITLLRSLSGVIRLELLRVQDVGDDEDEPSTSSIRKLDVSNETRDSGQAEVQDTSVSPVTMPDFTDDVGIVLNALHTKRDLPLSDDNSQDSLPSPGEERPREETSKEQIIVERPPDQFIDSDEERIESWPQPPTSLELQSNGVLNEPRDSMPQISNVTEKTDESNIDNENPVETRDNQVATSEEDTTSVTFSEDDFLDEIEDLSYTPSPESDRKRSSNVFEISRMPIKPGSSLTQNISPRTSEQIYSLEKKTSKEENIEMSLLRTDRNTELSRISIDHTMAETNMSLPEEVMSPLIPESFLNASQAVSSSQATTPEVPPPLPTTPLPSDEDLGNNAGQKVSPRDHSGQAMTMRERFEKVVKQENVAKGRFDYPLRPKSPLISRRSKSVDPSGPLVEVQVPSSLYCGQRLQNLIEELQKTISSGKAANEFQALREMTPVDNCPSGKRAINKEKNRYRNVLPYEKTRVILTGDEHMDYINANYINITVGSKKYHYIATQGPLPITTSDFWRMVWEQKCEVIAMVTLDMECGKVKCHRYWPESPELPVKVTPSLEVHLESVVTQRNFVQRMIRIENTEEKQSLNIVHLNFVAWPDHGVPKSACELVEFIKQFRARTSVGPCAVHCSAGIGRTGTLLTIDTCIKHIERGIEFDIYSIVHNLREQRPGMIQTKDQYLFCYQACVEILKSLQS